MVQNEYSYPLASGLEKYIKCTLQINWHELKWRMTMAENIQQIIFEVEGIVCTGCALDMENVMLNTDGVEEASVNFADGTFTIRYDADETDVRRVFEKVKKLGFRTKILSDSQ